MLLAGCERFNLHKGYSDEFEWDGDFVDLTPRDRFCRRYCSVVAVDALKFGNPRVQFTLENVNRELNKVGLLPRMYSFFFVNNRRVKLFTKCWAITFVKKWFEFTE